MLKVTLTTAPHSSVSKALDKDETLTHYPLPDDKILDWSKLKQIADDILKGIQNEK